MTGAHIAYIFAKDNCSRDRESFVLYCGPSNKSVDVVFGKIFMFCKGNVTACFVYIYNVAKMIFHSTSIDTKFTKCF